LRDEPSTHLSSLIAHLSSLISHLSPLTSHLKKEKSANKQFQRPDRLPKGISAGNGDIWNHAIISKRRKIFTYWSSSSFFKVHHIKYCRSMEQTNIPKIIY